jgi:hypothetical protein
LACFLIQHWLLEAGVDGEIFRDDQGRGKKGGTGSPGSRAFARRLWNQNLPKLKQWRRIATRHDKLAVN